MKTGSFGMMSALSFRTQPPFGADEQVLNEEYTRCSGRPSRCSIPSPLRRSIPALCSSSEGLFRARTLCSGICNGCPLRSSSPPTFTEPVRSGSGLRLTSTTASTAMATGRVVLLWSGHTATLSKRLQRTQSVGSTSAFLVLRRNRRRRLRPKNCRRSVQFGSSSEAAPLNVGSRRMLLTHAGNPA